MPSVRALNPAVSTRIPRRFAHGRGEAGFTLIELLVVILIIGILAAIAIPAFIGQRERAHDSKAKYSARTALTALEAFHVTNGHYNATRADLVEIEPVLGEAINLAVFGTRATFILSLDSAAGQRFGVVRTPSGAILRYCSTAGDGGCPSSGSW